MEYTSYTLARDSKSGRLRVLKHQSSSGSIKYDPPAQEKQLLDGSSERSATNSVAERVRQNYSPVSPIRYLNQETSIGAPSIPSTEKKEEKEEESTTRTSTESTTSTTPSSTSTGSRSSSTTNSSNMPRSMSDSGPISARTATASATPPRNSNANYYQYNQQKNPNGGGGGSNNNNEMPIMKSRSYTSLNAPGLTNGHGNNGNNNINNWYEYLPGSSPPASLRSLHQIQPSGSQTNLSTTPSITYEHQMKLPRLPIPSLEETLHKFPKVLEALQDSKQQQDTKKVVNELMNGDGPELQRLLMEYEKEGVETQGIGSYVEEFWNESYLSPDSTVVLNLNPFFVLEDAPDPKMAKDQLRRAASLAYASIKFASVLKQDTLVPDMFKGKPLCMDQFRALFGSSRHPNIHDHASSCDEVHVYSDSCHVAVLCKNQFYYFRALWPDNWDVAVDEADIHDILKAIRKHAHHTEDEKAANEAVGVLSSLPRSRWAKAREILCQSGDQNTAALNIIDSALFVLVLDDFTPKDVHETAANMLHGANRLAEDDTYQVGSCLNRWYDKLQLIVCEDGTAGCNFEHSAVDGHTALRFISDVFAETVISFADSIVDLIHGRGRIQHVVSASIKRAAKAIDDSKIDWDVYPRKIVFELPEHLLQSIYYAETALCDEVSASETFVLEFRDYGKMLIVSNSMSPDSVVQMAIMLSYYKLYGKVVDTYEPVLTKAYYHGRTEAMRSATPQAKELCEVWCNKRSSPEEKLQALRKATIEHSRLVKEASRGYGVDRHLFALKCIAQRNGMRTPTFFESEAWKTLNKTILSTSNCGNPSLRLFGFGPVVPDGFGIGYIIKDYGLSFSVSSKHRQTQRYVRSLKSTLREFKEIMKPTGGIQVEQRHSLMVFRHNNPYSEVPTAYDDVFGENSAQVPPPKRLPVLNEVHDDHLEEDEPPPSPRTGPRPASSRHRSSSFLQIKEKALSNDWLLDAEVRAAVTELAVEEGSDTEEKEDPASEGTHWYF